MGIVIEKLIELDPTKIYLLKISEKHATLDDIHAVNQELRAIRDRHGLIIIALAKGLDLIDAPKGYKIIKED